MLARIASRHLALRHVHPSGCRSRTQNCFHKLSVTSCYARTTSSIDGPIGSSLFTGKGTHYALETNAVERISQLLEHHHLRNWGFVIYRCTYGDNVAWSRFMDRMDERRNKLLTYKYGVEDPDDDIPKEVARRLDWRVEEDPTLDGATKDEVRRRFRQLVKTSLKPEESDEPTISFCANSENPRWNFCLHVDQASLDSVLRGCTDPSPESNRNAFVNLIRADEYWDHPDYDRFDWSTHVPPEDEDEDDPHDENEPEIEGCRLAEMGWMRVRADAVIPCLYELLMKRYVFHYIYVRPPEIGKA